MTENSLCPLLCSVSDSSFFFCSLAFPKISGESYITPIWKLFLQRIYENRRSVQAKSELGLRPDLIPENLKRSAGRETEREREKVNESV